MKILSTGYTNTPDFTDPELWLDRISFYTGILEALTKQHKVESIEQINYSGKLERNGVLYHFLNFKEQNRYFPTRLHNYIKERRPDIVFVNGFIFPLQITQLRLKLGKAAKIIVLHRAEKPFKRIKKYLQKLADKYVDAYLFASSEFIEEWKQNISVEKIYEVIQASSVFRPANKTDARNQIGVNGQPVFLWVGRLDANKDPLTVIQAFLQFLNYQPEARLYLIYQEKKLLAEVMSLVASDKKGKCSIILIGKIPHRRMQLWYSSADFIISSSHYEGSGIAISEAMSCGCIPVVTDIPSFRSMTGRTKCGFLFKAGNDQELLAALLKANEMDIEAGKARVLEQFRKELSFAAIANKINSVINSL